MVIPIHSDTVHTPPVPSVTVVVLRETFEESGLPLVQWSAAASLVQVLRAHKRTGARLAVALQQLGLPLAVFSLVPWSRWITPRVPSVAHKRFDPRLFMAATPHGQATERCIFEAAEAEWLTPPLRAGALLGRRDRLGAATHHDVEPI